MESDYKVIQIQKKSIPEDKYDFPITEIRYVIVSTSTNKVIDDAQGYGYKTKQNAEKAMWYKFNGGKSKLNVVKQSALSFWKSNTTIKDDLENIMFIGCKEGNDPSPHELVDYVKTKYNKDIDPDWIKYM